MSSKTHVSTKSIWLCIINLALLSYLFYQLIDVSWISTSVGEAIIFETTANQSINASSVTESNIFEANTNKPTNNPTNSMWNQKTLGTCSHSFKSSSLWSSSSSLPQKHNNLKSPITIDQILEEPQLYINITSFRQQYVTNNNSWILYRFSDMFANWRNYGGFYRDLDGGYKYHKKHFPNSIATEYMNKTNKSFDFQLLMKIIQNRSITQLIPSNDTLVIHLRTGDVIDCSSFSVVQILQNAFPKNMSDDDIFFRKYQKTLSFYENVIYSVSKYKFKKAIIVTGFHKTGNHDKAILYTAIITKLFEINGYDTSVRINQSPDDDLVLMCNSNFFVRAGGGFSARIATVVQLKGGIVFK